MEQRDKRIARKVRRSYIISTVSITLVLFMLGLVTLAALSAAHSLRERVVVSVEMADSLFASEQQVVLDKINSREEVARVDYLSKEDKVNDAAFRRQFELEIDELLGENPLRNSYEVTLKRELSTGEDIEAFVSAVEPTAGVEYISVPPVEVVEQMHSTITTISLGLLIFLAVLLVISLLLLHNTIRLAIYSKRYLINTLKLVGATKWYIMRPLLGSALKQGVWAGVISGLMIAFTVYGVEAFTPQGIAMLDHIAVGIIIGSTLSVGVVITLLYTAAAVNKFVNMKTNKIFLY